ncbi:hypothetical protein ACTXT7_009068 [Hymenolepis weldensis]
MGNLIVLISSLVASGMQRYRNHDKVFKLSRKELGDIFGRNNLLYANSDKYLAKAADDGACCGRLNGYNFGSNKMEINVRPENFGLRAHKMFLERNECSGLHSLAWILGKPRLIFFHLSEKQIPCVYDPPMPIIFDGKRALISIECICVDQDIL